MTNQELIIRTTKYKTKSIYFIFGFSLFLLACIDPIPPEFDFKEDIVIINALASTVPGATNVTVEKTTFEDGLYKTKSVLGCEIELAIRQPLNFLYLLQTRKPFRCL